MYEIQGIGSDFEEFTAATVLVNSEGEVSYLDNKQDGFCFSFGAERDKLSIINNDGKPRKVLVRLIRT